MVAELYAEHGFLSILVSFFVACILTVWLASNYPGLSGLAILTGIGVVIHSWFTGMPVGWLDIPFFILIAHNIYALLLTKEGWKLIFVVVIGWIILNVLEKMTGD